MDHNGRTIASLNVAVASMKQILNGAISKVSVAISAGQTIDHMMRGVDQDGLPSGLASALRTARLAFIDIQNEVPIDMKNTLEAIEGLAGIKPEPTAQDTPLNTQVGGDHYKKLAIQPVEYIHANNIPFCEGSAIKYLTRHRDKNGAEDLKKAIHFIRMILKLEYGFDDEKV